MQVDGISTFSSTLWIFFRDCWRDVKTYVLCTVSTLVKQFSSCNLRVPSSTFMVHAIMHHKVWNYSMQEKMQRGEQKWRNRVHEDSGEQTEKKKRVKSQAAHSKTTIGFIKEIVMWAISKRKEIKCKTKNEYMCMFNSGNVQPVKEKQLTRKRNLFSSFFSFYSFLE